MFKIRVSTQYGSEEGPSSFDNSCLLCAFAWSFTMCTGSKRATKPTWLVSNPCDLLQL